MQPAAQIGRNGCITSPSVYSSCCVLKYFAQPASTLRIELQPLQFPHRHLNFCECTQRAPQTAHLSWNERFARSRCPCNPFCFQRRPLAGYLRETLTCTSPSRWCFTFARCTICVFRSRVGPFLCSHSTQRMSFALLASECA